MKKTVFINFVAGIILYVISLLTSYSCNPSIKIEVSDNLVNSPWGMNVHLGFKCTSPYIDEICRAVKESGCNIIRVDAYWWYDNMFMEKEHCDRTMYYADKYGLDVLLVFPQLSYRTDSTFLRMYSDMFKTYCERYNGKTPISMEGSAIVRYPKIKYIEPCNEVEYHYVRQNLDVSQTFTLIKTASQAIKNTNPNIKIVLPGLSNQCIFLDSLLNYKDNIGNRLCNYCDIFNIHDYSWNAHDFNKAWKYWETLYKKSGFAGKPIWMTEYGKSLWETNRQNQADLLIKNGLLALSKGIDKIFYYQFHSYGGNYFTKHNQIEEYYGIIEPSISNSFVSFMENNGKYNKAISQGDGLDRVYIKKANKDSVSIYTINDTICKKLKKTGLAIGGNGFTLNEVSLYHKDNTKSIIWSGKIKIEGQGFTWLTLPQIKFQTISKDDKLVAYISAPADISDKWDGMKPMPAYYSYYLLSSILTSDCGRPVVNSYDNDLFICSWKNYKNNKYYYAIWCEKSEKKMMRINNDQRKSLMLTPPKLSKKIIENEISVSSTPMIIMNNKELTFDH